MKKLSFLFFATVLIALGYYGFLEYYYYQDQVAWLSPLPSEENLRIRRDPMGRGEFGAKRSGGRRHRGVDLVAEEGDPVVATRSGRVRVGHVPRGMGKFVTVTHRDGLKTIYGHLSRITVRDKSRVRQGQVIGAVGKTGNASSRRMKPHLHFEIRQDEKVLDPLPLFVSPEEDTAS